MRERSERAFDQQAACKPAACMPSMAIALLSRSAGSGTSASRFASA